VNDEVRGNRKQPTQPSQPSRPHSDISSHDLYFVCLLVADLLLTTENARLAPGITRRVQRLMDEVIEEYDTALRERDDLQARFDA